MKRKISSELTFIYKFIFPASWIGAFGMGTALSFLVNSEGVWVSLLALVLGTLFLYWGTMRLKDVQVDQRYLYVSDFRRTIRVQFSQIAKVTENRFINIHPVWIKFKSPTPFGRTIMFMPTFHWRSLFLLDHPVVEELRTRAGIEQHNDYA